MAERVYRPPDVTVVRPSYRTEKPRPGRTLLRALRQTIESVNDTFKGQLGLEQHGGRTTSGVAVRVQQRILALTAAIWHNWQTGQPVLRSLTAYDHRTRWNRSSRSSSNRPEYTSSVMDPRRGRTAAAPPSRSRRH
jgi:hypothetical protein